MLKPSRTDPAPCPGGCGCPVCTDVCTDWLADLRDTNPHNRLAPWDLVRRRHTWPAWTSKRNH